MAIQRYEVDPLDGEYRCDSGNWVQYEDHVLEMKQVVEQRDKLLAAIDASTPCYAVFDEYHDNVCGSKALEVMCNRCKDNKALIAEIRDSMIQSTHGKETDGPAVSN